MTKRARFLGLVGLAALSVATPRAIAAPALRVQVDQQGDFTLIGNTLGYDCLAGTPVPVVGTVGACGTNAGSDTAPDIFWRADAPAAGQAQANNTVTVAQARSTAVLAVPAGATVTHAFLYWGATAATATADQQITLDTPGGAQTVDAIGSYTGANNSYQSVANVTTIVQAAGNGAYRVSGVDVVNLVNRPSETDFAGWWMAVFYQLASDPPRNLALFDGLDRVSNGNNQNVNISGFLVPNAGFDAKLGVITFEGDNSINGDQLFFNGGAALTDAQNPANNFFNGTRSWLGAAVSNVGDLPQLTGTAQSMSGIDIDVVDVTSRVAAGQTSAPIQATSTQDQYFLAGFVTSISTFRPDFTTSVKSAVDVNGGALLAGDVIEYSIDVMNTGNDSSINTVLNDALPAGVTFVPGSLQITAGVNAGAKTDAAGDDQGDYDGTSRTVSFRLGTGANGTQGGSMAINETASVKFQVTIDAGVSGSISNQGIITAGGSKGAPPGSTPTDGNGGGPGQPPTDIVVDECELDTHCQSPTPRCDTATDPNKCVQCLVDLDCAVPTPVCDTTTGTCICVPTNGGVETCDGLDNDCNGTIDDGFNVGGSCTNGTGGCQTTGTVFCSSGAAACDAVPGTPGTETCNSIDDDCDGTTDNGFNLGATCTSGVGVCQTTGGLVCDSTGGTTCGAVPGTPVTEICNGLDDDCDGTADNGFNVGGACTNGVGACQRSGTIECTVGLGVCNAVPGTPGTETCNGIDDDCNGTIDDNCADTDGDGLSDALEKKIRTDPNDADTDDDGVIDGQEPSYDKDSDGDGLINALDPDSDNDGLFDGTERGLDCSNSATNTARGNCIPDADSGATTTDPLDRDTDNGSVSDGNEDPNRNGKIDTGETDPNDPSDDVITDSDGDGLSDAFEDAVGTDPNDADSDDDGVIDGQEANVAADSDGDGLINGLDEDSDDDGLFDGTEMGKDCANPATDSSQGHCTADADDGTTRTSPVDPDTDHGGESDGSEDGNKNGQIDTGERDPNNPADDNPCTTDSDCGSATSGVVCDTGLCLSGCRGTGGNGCPTGLVCSSTDDTIGECVTPGDGGTDGGPDGAAGGAGAAGSAGTAGTGGSGGQAATGGAAGADSGAAGTGGTGGANAAPGVLEGGGCSCSIPGSQRSPLGPLGLLAIGGAGVIWRARRRRGRRS